MKTTTAGPQAPPMLATLGRTLLYISWISVGTLVYLAPTLRPLQASVFCNQFRQTVVDDADIMGACKRTSRARGGEAFMLARTHGNVFSSGGNQSCVLRPLGPRSDLSESGADKQKVPLWHFISCHGAQGSLGAACFPQTSHSGDYGNRFRMTVRAHACMLLLHACGALAITHTAQCTAAALQPLHVV